MTEQEGFDKAFIGAGARGFSDICLPSFEEGWGAALEWALSQQEPEFQVFGDSTGARYVVPKGQEIEGWKIPLQKLYTHPAPTPDVRELVEALRYIEGVALCNELRDLNTIAAKAQEALAKWEAKQ